MNDWFLRRRVAIYVLAQVALAMASIISAGSQGINASAALYVDLLFALCTAPLLLLKRINDRYVLLGVFMGTYFLIFGALDLQNIFTGADLSMAQDGFVTPARVGVLVGAALALAGYAFGAGLAGTPARNAVPTAWSNGAVLAVGLGCWLFGSAAMAYYSLYAVTENTVQATASGLADMGPVLTFVVMLGNLVQPVGLVVLAYGHARNRNSFWLMLVISVVLLQVVLGFVTDTKGTALFGFLLVALTKTVWDGKVSKPWIVSIIVFAALLFPVFQASRIVVREQKGMNRYQALLHIDEVLQSSLETREKLDSGRAGDRPATFIERSSSQANVERVFDHTGVDIPYLKGSTLVALPLAFVPRLILPDKQDVQVGQLYARTFFHTASDDFTYISVSELGELYWNFGWLGVVIGMTLTGGILGVVGARSELADTPSLTRLLVLLVTMKTLCFGFGGSIALSYIVWLRALAAIGLLHLMYSRPSQALNPGRSSSQPAIAFGQPVPRFSNLLR